MAHPVVIARSRGFKRGWKETPVPGVVFKPRNRPAAVQVRHIERFIEFPLEEEFGDKYDSLVEELEGIGKHGGRKHSGSAGIAYVCKGERALEIFEQLKDIHDASKNCV